MLGADKVHGLVNVSSTWEGADNQPVNKILLVVMSNVTVSDFRACWGRVERECQWQCLKETATGNTKERITGRGVARGRS